jgi:hypothetical protein
MTRKYQPGGPCCCGGADCGWLDDDFSGSLNQWTIPTGDTWATTSGYAYSDDSSSILLSTVTYPYNSETTRKAGERRTVNPFHQHSVVCSFKGTADGQVLVIVVTSDEDAENYIALEVTLRNYDHVNSGSFRLIEVTSSGTTAISQTFFNKRLRPGVLLHGAVDFDNGDLRASVSDTLEAHNLSGIGSGESGWVRVIRADDQGVGAGTDEVAYHGEYVGFGISVSQSSNVEFHWYEAGCHGVREYCVYERDNIPTASATWWRSDWIKLAGTWPGRSSNVIRVLDGNSVKMRLRNRLPVRHLNAQSLYINGYINGYPGTVFSVLFAGDSTFSTGYEAKTTFLSSPPDHFKRKWELIRLSDSGVLFSNTEAVELPNGMAVGLPASLIFVGDVINWANMSYHLAGESTPDDAYVGFEAAPVDADLNISQVRTQRIGPANEHWERHDVQCPGMIYGAECVHCLEPNDWPYTWILELWGIVNSLWDECSLCNATVYCNNTSNCSNTFLLPFSPVKTLDIGTRVLEIGGILFSVGMANIGDPVFLTAAAMITFWDPGYFPDPPAWCSYSMIFRKQVDDDWTDKVDCSDPNVIGTYDPIDLPYYGEAYTGNYHKLCDGSGASSRITKV